MRSEYESMNSLVKESIELLFQCYPKVTSEEIWEVANNCVYQKHEEHIPMIIYQIIKSNIIFSDLKEELKKAKNIAQKHWFELYQETLF